MFPPRKRWQTTANVFFFENPDPKAENVSVGHPDSKSQSEVILHDSRGTKICIYKHIYIDKNPYNYVYIYVTMLHKNMEHGIQHIYI